MRSFSRHFKFYRPNLYMLLSRRESDWLPVIYLDLTQISWCAVIYDLSFNHALILVPPRSSMTAVAMTVVMVVSFTLPLVSDLAFPLNFADSVLAAAANIIRQLHELEDVLL